MRNFRLLMVSMVALAMLLSVATPAGAAQQKPTPVYTIVCTSDVGTGGNICPNATSTGTASTTGPVGAAAIGGINGNAYSPQGTGGAVITLIRKECYVFFCTPDDYQAHLHVTWAWNVLAYGGVVFNVTRFMWADHFKATISQQGPAVYYNEGYFTYTSHYGNTSSVGGYQENGLVEIQQCVPNCVQSETVLAYVHAHDDGSWVADISHS